MAGMAIIGVVGAAAVIAVVPLPIVQIRHLGDVVTAIQRARVVAQAVEFVATVALAFVICNLL